MIAPGEPEEPDTPTEPEEPTNPSAGIGVFSVSADKQVTFSKGNLQYTQSTNTWSFAENQWDYIGTDNVIGGSVSSDSENGNTIVGAALADKIDLFGWSTEVSNFGVSDSNNKSDYSGAFVDWGANKIGNDAPNTWRTLTYDEWNYVSFNRANAENLRGVACVNGINGLILLPDNWISPTGVTFKSGYHSSSGVEYYADFQYFNTEQWSKLETAGAIFLPASGFRPSGLEVYRVQSESTYWSSNSYDSGYAWRVSFRSSRGGMHTYNRYSGHSVRLVKDL
jgi:hypothetical protein